MVLIGHHLTAHGVVAHICTKIAGVDPLDHIAIFHSIFAAAEVGEITVDIVHPTGQRAAVKFIQVLQPP